MIPIISAYLVSNRNLVQGTVVNNNDPEQKGRLRVHIDGLTDQLQESMLPWYSSSQNINNSYTKVPPQGTRVAVHYIDVYNCLVLGSIQSRS